MGSVVLLNSVWPRMGFLIEKKLFGTGGVNCCAGVKRHRRGVLYSAPKIYQVWYWQSSKVRLQVFLPMAGAWNQMIFQVSSKPNHSIIVWFPVSQINILFCLLVRLIFYFVCLCFLTLVLHLGITSKVTARSLFYIHMKAVLYLIRGHHMFDSQF